MRLVPIKMKLYIFVICCVALFVSVSGDFSALSLQSTESVGNGDDNIVKNEMIRTEQSLISKMIERGKILVKSIPKTGLKLAGRVWDFVPTPETIFNVSKQTLIGLPQELIAYAVNSVCSAAIHLNAIKPSFTPSVHRMNFELLTHSGENITISLLEPHRLWNHSKFRQDWNVVLLVTGWNSNINKTNEALDAIYSAYRERDFNFVVFDTAHFIDSLYTWSAFNTEKVGHIIGAAIVELTNFVELDRIHLIGHSLGAHICGYAGRHFHSLTEKLVPRITGLDPARPCFNEGERLNGLQRGDARFVDIIHSNAGILGVKNPIGDVDFYPNGRYALQPGCWTIVCAHSRSYEYYAETVRPGNENNFIATRCNSFSSFKNGKCSGRPIPMGINTPPTARGSYYLHTNKKSPFGMKLRSIGRYVKSVANNILHNANAENEEK